MVSKAMCPNCGNKMLANHDDIGQQYQCPTCGRPFWLKQELVWDTSRLFLSIGLALIFNIAGVIVLRLLWGRRAMLFGLLAIILAVQISYLAACTIYSIFRHDIWDNFINSFLPLFCIGGGMISLILGGVLRERLSRLR